MRFPVIGPPCSPASLWLRRAVVMRDYLTRASPRLAQARKPIQGKQRGVSSAAPRARGQTAVGRVRQSFQYMVGGPFTAMPDMFVSEPAASAACSRNRLPEFLADAPG